MRKSSKQILQLRREALTLEPLTPVAWTVLGVSAFGLVYWLGADFSRWGACLFALFVIGIWIQIAVLIRRRRFHRMAQERVGESICQFARHFRGPGFDPVLVRAVYETLQEQHGRRDVPVRPTDSFAVNYDMDDGDLNEFGEDIARLSGRSFQDDDEDLFYGQSVKSVADFVYLMEQQPKVLA